jgi:hypothetical protein
VEGAQSDIGGGAFHEAPGFDVEEEFHAARGSGGCQIGCGSEWLTERVGGLGKSDFAPAGGLEIVVVKKICFACFEV